MDWGAVVKKPHISSGGQAKHLLAEVANRVEEIWHILRYLDAPAKYAVRGDDRLLPQPICLASARAGSAPSQYCGDSWVPMRGNCGN